MPKQIISANPADKKVFQKDGDNFLRISEFYYDTIQGEGIYAGHPAAFLRLQGCTLSCSYCDTDKVWRYGNPYTFKELINLIDSSTLPEKLKRGQHLVITGGSPLLQEERLCKFLFHFRAHYGFLPFIELENECVIDPEDEILNYVSCWNNSPKLSNSGVPENLRYESYIIRFMAGLKNSWFKFVVSSEEDWDEIEEDFLKPRLVKKEQIILMPNASSRVELEEKRMAVVEMAISHSVRYCTREHIILWNKKAGF